jgi:hypothetical protein
MIRFCYEGSWKFVDLLTLQAGALALKLILDSASKGFFRRFTYTGTHPPPPQGAVNWLTLFGGNINDKPKNMEKNERDEL